MYSHLAIFAAVLLLQIAGLSITFLNCSGVLAAVAAAALVWARRGATEGAVVVESDSPGPRWHKFIFIAVAAMGLAMGYVAFFCPLGGWDTAWRWDFLARQIASLHSLSYYPAHSPADYMKYGYPDGFPPLVSSVYAYLYLGGGRSVPEMTGIVVTLQWAAALALAARAADGIQKGAGQWAALLFAACGVVFRGAAIGQETGLTSLATAAVFAAAVSPRATRLALALPLTALALCREYGPGLAAAGGVFLFMARNQTRDDRQRVLHALLLAVAFSISWSIRTWSLTGNPLWSHEVLGLPVNPVHVRIMAYYQSIFSPGSWTALQWRQNLIKLVERGGAPLILFAPACWMTWRRFPRLALGSLIYFVAGTLIWVASIGLTSGGAAYSMRVLTPAMVIAAVVSGVWFAAQWEANRLRKLLLGIAAASYVFAAVEAARLIAPEESKALFRPLPAPLDGLVAENQAVVRSLSPGSRILSDNMYLHAALTEAGLQVVPIWSPEVAFIFDPSLSTHEIVRRLVQLKISIVMMQHASDHFAYNVHALRTEPFFEMLNTQLRPTTVVNTTCIWSLSEPEPTP